MAMLITERAIINPQRTTRVRHIPQTVALPETLALPESVVQSAPVVSSQPHLKRGVISHTIQRLGDRQSWLLLVLVLIPVFGAISNLLTYGLAR